MNIRITPIIPALLVAAIGFSAPTLTSSSRRMYTPDPHSMDIVEDDDGIPRMEVRGFTTPTAARTGYNFADILTNKNVSVSNLKVLLRDGTGDDRELKYADLAKITGFQGGHDVDDHSVTTNKSHGAIEDGNASLYGFDSAGNKTVPYKDSDSENTLKWSSEPDAGATADKPVFLSYDGSAVGWSYGSTLPPDNETISTNETGHVGELAVKGAYVAANKDKVLSSTGNGTAWIKVEGMGGHGVDDMSVTTNSDNNATLVGFGGASKWDIAYVSDENGKKKIAWRRLDDDDTITTRSASGALSEGSFSLYGFSGADDFAFPYKKENATLGWGLFDDNSFDWDGEYLSLKDIYANHGKVLYSNNGQVGWGIIDADESSIHVEDNSKTWTFSLYDYSSASDGHIPFKGGADLDWGGIVGDGQTVEFEGLFDGLDSMIYLHGTDQPSNFDKYSYLDDSGELQWIDPVENKSTQIYKYAGFNRVQLYGWTDGQKALPYNNGSNLAWLQFSGSSSENQYLASDGSSIFWVNNPQKGEKGDPGEPGAAGKDGTDGNPGEWFTNHVAEVVQLLIGTSNFVTSVNGEKGDVVLKDLIIEYYTGTQYQTEYYNGSAEVYVPLGTAEHSIHADEASYAEMAGVAYRAETADNATMAGEAEHAFTADTANHAISSENSTDSEHAWEADHALTADRLTPTTLSAARTVTTNAVKSAGSASHSGLSFSANGSVLTITDGTHTWKLDAQ